MKRKRVNLEALTDKIYPQLRCKHKFCLKCVFRDRCLAQ